MDIETKAAKRSTANGSPQTHAVSGTAGYYEVPSYYARPGYSVDEAAKSLGLRPLSRRENVQRDDILAEIHERGGACFRCVRL